MKVKQGSKNSIAMYMILSFLFLVISIGFIFGFVNSIKYYIEDKSCNYEKVEAIITHYDKHLSRTNTYKMEYTVYYEYVDENGYSYSGIWDRGSTENEEKVQEFIGTKVPIYVDTQKHRHKTAEGTNIGIVCITAIAMVIFIPIFIFSFIRLILSLIHWYKKNIKYEDFGEENVM